MAEQEQEKNGYICKSYNQHKYSNKQHMYNTTCGKEQPLNDFVFIRDFKWTMFDDLERGSVFTGF